MNANVFGMDGGPAAVRPAFYFDYGPLLPRGQAFGHDAGRVRMMCEHCVRRLAPADIMLPDGNGFFLVLQSAQGAAAETLAHDIHIALLELFFGADAANPIHDSTCRKATLAEIESKGIVIPPPTRAAASALGHVEADPLARLARGGLPGYEGLTTGFAPLVNLSRETSSLFLCGAVRQRANKTLFGMPALAGIDARDRASLDDAMLEYSLGHARSMLPTTSATAIVTPVHYETLAWSRGRQLYQNALRTPEAAKNPFLLVKIEGVPSGTPAARLMEVVAMVRPFVRRLFVELTEWDPNLLRGGHLGAAGFMMALPDGVSLGSAGRIMSNLSQLAAAQQAVACVSNVDGPNQLALARTAGIRFAIRSAASGGVMSGTLPQESECGAAHAA